ncbi:MAG: DEAD/DEAH box helicase family protein [Gammaproteobacteria bacterium]
MPERRRRNTRPQVPFTYKLVMNQWLFSLFGLPSSDGLFAWNGRKLPLLEAFKQKFQLNEESAGGLDENNIHRFHTTLTNQTEGLDALPDELLLEYDQNIVRHTQRLNECRLARGDEPVTWKYFQYLTLLFTEIYLDRYFRDPHALLASINEQIRNYNNDKPEADQVPELDPEGDITGQLNKLAFWNATGSGKTLIMHANIMQYQHYLDLHGRRRDLNRIILLTPNEGLSLQHLEEFRAAGIEAELFDKDGRGLFAGHSVEIIDIHKLRDEMGDKTIAVDAFENNNLVLVDEGHRGASGGEEGKWMDRRSQLCEKGFSFEYSATFGQAVKGSPQLTAQYARCILFDYSYKYFYGDGYGKDYQILNLDSQTQDNYLENYLVACLLAFYQQLRLYADEETALRPFHIEKPLWIFVGGRVTASLSTKDASDIVEILLFLSRFVSDKAAYMDHIRRILNDGLTDAHGRNLFAGRFAWLNKQGVTPERVYEDVLNTVFNAAAAAALHVENIKGVTGEIALRLGDYDAFGVINVGDDKKLCDLCEDQGLLTGESDFKDSLFNSINREDSAIKLLIGSRKFTEGWNSWRVSTMGLMNIGSTEGSQIIQLFGRGVRLKGYNESLKRSGRTHLPEEVERPRDMSLLETLNIFGIRANYMAQFREFLEEEGLPPNDEREEFLLPVIKNLGGQKLKTIRLKKKINGISTESGDAFKRLGPVPTLQVPDPDLEEATQYLQKNRTVLNWYPKIQALKSSGAAGGDQDSEANYEIFTARHVAFLDLDRLYFELQRFKAERGWYNLNLSRRAIADLLQDSSWYYLLIPHDQLAFDSFGKVALWQEIATSLLKKYCERYYTFRKRQWELPHLEYREIDDLDPNFPNVSEDHPDGYYRVLVEKSQEEIIAKLRDLKEKIEAGELDFWEFRGLEAMRFQQHLYQPLLHLTGSVLEISPVPLNRGEWTFVKDLKEFYRDNGDFFNDKELYLLRNLSKGKGVGFFEAGNFHPDFILWLKLKDQQYVNFVDPKGVRNLPWDDPKLNFCTTIKDIEGRLGDPNINLNSFIISNTPLNTMKMQWRKEKEEMEKRHILFQTEDKETYIRSMMDRIVSRSM